MLLILELLLLFLMLNVNAHGMANNYALMYDRVQLKCISIGYEKRGRKDDATLKCCSSQDYYCLSSRMSTPREWSEDLASEALLESKSRSTESPYLVLREKRLFQKSDPRSLDEKVLITLRSCFSREGYKVRRLPNGTQYGCDGIFNTKRGYRNLMSLVCIYDKH
ncbi:hypothetical protein TELCIR_00013 [Teladorsagia circumcincta]|uniref:SCP domain-containing protein n=1 Tax=Teladorsagia circumcincta TaxID=45464 RepID=A0A2G9V5S2_TELCI|nr:hypothetical protein TELCIR_00013 [Teladorsagia circumcincta]